MFELCVCGCPRHNDLWCHSSRLNVYIYFSRISMHHSIVHDARVCAIRAICNSFFPPQNCNFSSYSHYYYYHYYFLFFFESHRRIASWERENTDTHKKKIMITDHFLWSLLNDIYHCTIHMCISMSHRRLNSSMRSCFLHKAKHTIRHTESKREENSATNTEQNGRTVTMK